MIDRVLFALEECGTVVGLGFLGGQKLVGFFLLVLGRERDFRLVVWQMRGTQRRASNNNWSG
jgi:hypothetical protein